MRNHVTRVSLVAAIVLSLLVFHTLATTQETGRGSPNAEAQVGFEWEALGEQVYSINCSSCHQADGEGVPGAFPPLAGHMPALYSADGGRDYLINVLLFGLQGPIEAAGQNYNGIMPGWSQLSDEEIAAVLNHELTSWGNEELFGEDFMLVSPEDVAAGRDDTLTAQQVHELRGSLDIGQPQEGANASETSEQDTSNPSVTEMQASFTQAQAERGRTDYLRHCADCHGENLAGGEFGGPPLKGSYFMQRWGGNTAAALHGYTSTQMPQDRPGSLSERTYIEILAYILQGNGYPVGQEELEPNLELLQQIIIEPQSDSQ